ncbi:MAG: SDR family NAD(P)-dependent oxidoreductase [Candidatus Puniceispirillaceae bacterium]
MASTPKKTHYFITGVSAGIGKALVEALTTDGHIVSGVARRKDKLDELAEQCKGFTGHACDVTDKDELRTAIKNAIEANGPVDVLIPNAGIYIPDKKATIDMGSFELHMQVNYMATITCLSEILPQMLARQSGHIALMASVAGYRGLPRSLAYGPTKAALINLAEALRFDLKGSNVKIQVICPGFVETEATSVNDFDMPDIISAKMAAHEIIQGLKSQDFEIAFPKRFASKMKWLKRFPNDIYFKLVSKATR